MALDNQNPESGRPGFYVDATGRIQERTGWWKCPCHFWNRPASQECRSCGQARVDAPVPLIVEAGPAA